MSRLAFVIAGGASVAAAMVLLATRKRRKAAEVIDGKAIAKKVRSEVAEEVKVLVSETGIRPGLGVLLVGDRRDSETYVRNKKRAAEEVGFYSVDVKLPATASEEDVLDAVRRLNQNDKVHAILVQLPLPKHIDEATVLKAIAVDKDADGFAAENVGNACTQRRGFAKGKPPFVLPCTPAGCIELLKRSDVVISGKNAVVLGRSNIVGFPCSVLLESLDATVTVCHSRTADLASHLRRADIVIAAIGKPNFVKAHWLKPGAVVIDVGINAVDDHTAKRGYRLVGDVDARNARWVASKITPVPGGVGPMTIAMLTRNTLDLAKHHAARSSQTTRAKLESAGHREGEAEKKQTIRLSPVPSDIAVSQAANTMDISLVARDAGILPSECVTYGRHKAKVCAESVRRRLGDGSRRGSLVVVCGINPTKFGEGKSTTVVGLSQALGKNLGKKVVTTIRQPSQGPMFGIKGGAAGGGYSQVVPMEEMNSHLTGDIHAVSAANNLVAAALDARVFHERTQSDESLLKRLCPKVVDKDTKKTRRNVAAPLRERLERLGFASKDDDFEKVVDKLSPEQVNALVRLDVDSSTITWKRVLDTCDRFLRQIEIGRAVTEKGQTRETGFDIAVASEIMSVLALATDAADMRRRLGSMTVAKSTSGKFVTCDDLGVTGAVAVLVSEALMPTLMQTLEGTPVLVHCGPFANIAAGNSSVVADRLALDLVGNDGFVVTEAGFGADIGGEKNFDIKARIGGLSPDCVVIVATVRALKSHGTTNKNDDLASGCANVQHHVRCVVEYFGLPCVVAVNRFAFDTDEEIEIVRRKCLEAGADDAVEATHFSDGGDGAEKLARAVVAACSSPKKSFRHLYPLDASIADKISTICTKLYLASPDVEYSDLAKAQLEQYEQDPEVNRLPICIAKTQYSLSTDPNSKGAPTGHTFRVRELVPRLGAGFIVVLAGDIMTIPGLPTRPNYYDIDVDPHTGKILGLS